ncbi:MAG: VanZ family protein [Clostridia bacterium]|nr:VanZ family protein [Clostridia bacterium]
MKRTIKELIFALAVLGVTAFIFSNSLKGIDASVQDSDAVIAIIRPILEALGIRGDINWHFIVRKGAHLTEFALLGVAVALFVIAVKRDKRLRGYELVYPLGVAAADELIQSFSDRTSQLDDVLIDFVGATVGFCAVWLISYLIFKRKKDENRHE